MKNKVLLLTLAGLSLIPSTGFCTIDASLTTLVSDVSDYFGTIKTVVITVVVFGVAISFAKLLKRR